jgi:hypothetical protein
MTDPSSIRKFEYRPCRISTGFEIDFVVGEDVFHGACRDVSDSGIRATLDDSVTVGGAGRLTLRHPIGILELDAQVAYIEKHHVGLVFLFRTPWESAKAIDYMASIANYEADPLVVRFV